MTGKKILITGATNGIGAELSRQYAKRYGENITLFLNGRDEGRLSAIHKDCERLGATVISSAIDVRAQDILRQWILNIQKNHVIDLVIANAGIAGGPGDDGALEDPRQVRDIFDINFYGVLNTIDPVLPDMIERKKGHIAFMGSLAGVTGLPTAPAYSTSKAAIKTYAQALDARLRPFGITTTLITPGFVKSGITDQNDFNMPFFWSTERAARKIINGLEKQKAKIAFPWQMVLSVHFLAILPRFIRLQIIDMLPTKKPR